MPDALRTELKLPADDRLLRLVPDYGRGLAEFAWLPAKKTENLNRPGQQLLFDFGREIS